MSIIEGRHYQPLTDDPDDYRPNSEIALVVDPATETGDYVHKLVLLFEHCAPGDRIPLHTHQLEEVMVIDEGTAEVVLGEERRTVGSGTVIFVPAGTPHGLRNAGEQTLHLHGVFPSDVLDIRQLERNSAPGAEGDPPQPSVSIPVREPWHP